MRIGLVLFVPLALASAAQERPAGEMELMRSRAEAESAFLAATRDIDAPVALKVLKSIFTVPPADGRILYDLVIKNNYKRVLDVGTGRGASAVWLALAARQTGGKVTTIEFNPTIAESARRNFEGTEVADRIDLVTGDARREIGRMQGDFDFIFVDIGSKDAMSLIDAIYPRLAHGGAIAVHDVLVKGIETEYVEFVRRQTGLRTTVHRSSSYGLAVSTKR